VYCVAESYPETAHILADAFYSVLRAKYGDQKNLFYTCPWGGLFNRKRKIDFTKVVCTCRNVVSFAIMLAIYLGYKEIVLVGCDYSLFATRVLEHCYDEKDGSEKVNLLDMLYRYSFATDIHYELAVYAKGRGVKIINATAASLLDAYPIEENYFERR
jgi:hypothetical protein